MKTRAFFGVMVAMAFSQSLRSQSQNPDGVYCWEGYRSALFAPSVSDLEGRKFSYKNPILQMRNGPVFYHGDFGPYDSSYTMGNVTYYLVKKESKQTESIWIDSLKRHAIETKVTRETELISIEFEPGNDNIILVSVLATTRDTARLQTRVRYIKQELRLDIKEYSPGYEFDRELSRISWDGFFGQYQFQYQGKSQTVSFYGGGRGEWWLSSRFKSKGDLYHFNLRGQYNYRYYELLNRYTIGLIRNAKSSYGKDVPYTVNNIARDKSGNTVTRFSLIAVTSADEYSIQDTIHFEYVGEPKKIKIRNSVNYDLTKAVMPGAYYEINAGNNDSLGSVTTYGLFTNLVYRIAQTDDRGPSHWRIYAKLGETRFSNENNNPCFTAGLGSDFSFERNPHRNWVIPTFGFEYQFVKRNAIENFNFARSTIGVNLFCNRYIALHGTLMYSYCFERIESMSGIGYGVNAVISLW